MVINPAPARSLYDGDRPAEKTFVPSGTKVLERTLFLPFRRAEVFQFFSHAENLGLITPPGLEFEITSPLPIAMQVGALIDYRIRLHSIPMRWRTRIERWEPPHLFVDYQLQGPYRHWIHHHEFREMGEGTEVTDRVWYRLPALGPFSRPAHAMVRKQLDSIFDYRASAVRNVFMAKSDS